MSDYQKAKQQKDWSSSSKAQDSHAFHKPRALSRQAEANIKIEVHRDETIVNHLQAEQRTNMNLMFYDFNGSS